VTYAKLGQTYSPARWGGQVQFGMWLLRPRLVREFRNWIDPMDTMQPYFEPVLTAVDRVHANESYRRSGARERWWPTPPARILTRP